MKVGLEDRQHEAGECYTRKIASHWEDGQTCGDPRCDEARALWIESEVNRTGLAVYMVAPNDPQHVLDRAAAILDGRGFTRVSNRRWLTAHGHGPDYADYRGETPYMLLLGENGGTFWGPVTIVPDSEWAQERLSHGTVDCTTCGESLKPFGDYWVHSRIEIPDHQPTYVGGSGVHAP